MQVAQLKRKRIRKTETKKERKEFQTGMICQRILKGLVYHGDNLRDSRRSVRSLVESQIH